MDLEAVRTFVAVADTGQFQSAGDELRVTQQAVSKRVAALERAPGVRLFTRTPRGARLSVDGRAFLPHARELLAAQQRALASVAPGRRALRVDVLNRRTAPATLLHAFYQQDPSVVLDVVTLPDVAVGPALDAVTTGTVDATFRALVDGPDRLAGTPLEAARVVLEPHELLVGPAHALADARAVTLAELAAHPVWMPGLAPGGEASTYYAELAETFGLTIDLGGPLFSAEVQLTEIAASPTLATLVGPGSRYFWPASYDLRRIPVVDPVPVFPLSVVWRRDNAHPVLASLLAFLRDRHGSRARGDEWLPRWARRPDL
ncbi:LysR family transcriptional regulator [Pseudonocardia dioxanivorans]|uniref:LysR family transcriptional regulator n=1 Tax=Pseudonocardia dioxanivorans TaxID=240495 RepID=UPI0002F676A4|nr:LysR family transcriptional regulator [Pseudonocardia dioxanivorans]